MKHTLTISSISFFEYQVMETPKLLEIIEKLPPSWQNAIKKAVELLDKSKNYEDYVKPIEGTLNVSPLKWVILTLCLFLGKLETSNLQITNHEVTAKLIEDLIQRKEETKYKTPIFMTGKQNKHNEWLKEVKQTYKLQSDSKLLLGLGKANLRTAIKWLVLDSKCIEYAKKGFIIWDFLRHWDKISKFIKENNCDITTRKDLEEIYKELVSRGLIKLKKKNQNTPKKNKKRKIKQEEQRIYKKPKNEEEAQRKKDMLKDDIELEEKSPLQGIDLDPNLINYFNSFAEGINFGALRWTDEKWERVSQFIHEKQFYISNQQELELIGDTIAFL